MVAEVAAVRVATAPLGDVAHEDAGADDVLEPGADGPEARLDLVQDIGGLRRRVAPGHHVVGPVRRRRAAHQHPVADAERPRVARDLLPDAAARDPAAVAVGYRFEDPGEGAEMVAEVARGGEEGRAAVLVAAIAGNRAAGGEGGLEAGVVLGVEGEGEGLEVGFPVVALAGPGTHDDRRHGRLVEHPAGRHIGDLHAMLFGNGTGGGEDPLEGVQPPMASMKRRYFILDQSAMLAGSFAPSQRSSMKPPASVP